MPRRIPDSEIERLEAAGECGAVGGGGRDYLGAAWQGSHRALPVP